NTMECLEVREMFFDRLYFPDSLGKNSMVPPCQMKVKTWHGQVGRQRNCGLMKQLEADSH
ncbi:hypothetical protein P7M41_26885, partial [Vibrio parahaemolyticus]|nr:hypothetical protein [Vibrio parahaemolyticus]